MYEDSACLEMLFKNAAPDVASRIGWARDAGYRAFEFWHWSNKDLDAIERAKDAAGIDVTGFLMEPQTRLVNPAEHGEFLQGLAKSIFVAQRFKAPFLFMQGGHPLEGVGRDEQTAAMVDALQKAANVLRGSGVTLLLEPVSDNPGCFLDLGAEGLDIVERVNRPEVRLLFDVYHSMVMGEDFMAAIADRIDLIGHVHLADFPGRGAPGTGKQDLNAIKEWFRIEGYTGRFGLEYIE